MSGQVVETQALRINNELARAGWSASHRNLVEEFAPVSPAHQTEENRLLTSRERQQAARRRCRHVLSV